MDPWGRCNSKNATQKNTTIISLPTLTNEFKASMKVRYSIVPWILKGNYTTTQIFRDGTNYFIFIYLDLHTFYQKGQQNVGKLTILIKCLGWESSWKEPRLHNLWIMVNVARLVTWPWICSSWVFTLYHGIDRHEKTSFVGEYLWNFFQAWSTRKSKEYTS